MEKLDQHELLYLYESLERVYEYHWGFAVAFIQLKKERELREFENREYIRHSDACDKARRMQEKLSKIRREIPR
jgi:hypothetical protein